MITGIRKERELGVRWNRTNRSKEYRGRRTNRITQGMYNRNEIRFKRMRTGLNNFIAETFFLRLNRVTDVPICPMRRWK
jgi:hypothetical protein